MKVTSGSSSRAAKRSKSSTIASKTCLVEVDEIHLVHAHDDVRDPEQRADERVALGLGDHALARVDQDDRQVSRRGARDHVPGVLLVPRRVGDDEPPLGGREVAVGDVDRDALLALGTEPVGEQ